MSNSKPLTYLSLRVVMEKLEANKRLEVSIRCPSLRNLDMAIPLKLNHLSIFSRSIVINDLTYRICAIRKYKKYAQWPQFHQDENDRGIEVDLDEFGFIEKPTDDLTPGDIFISDGMIEPTRPRGVFPHNGPTYEDSLEEWTSRLAELKEKLEKLRPPGYREHECYEVDRDICFTESDIDKIERKIQPLRDRKDNLKPPFEVMIQLRISKRIDFRKYQTRIEEFKKTQKLDVMFKHLTTRLFGNRRHPIQVKTLSFPYSMKILRLPMEVKFQVEKLRGRGNIGENLEALEPIFKDSEVPEWEEV